MRDIPMFTTEYGIASLFLKNLASNKEAYIRLVDCLDPDKMLKECCDFCRSAGAEKVFASGHDFLKNYEVYTMIIQMTKDNSFPQTDALLFPVQEETMEKWRSIYNEKMRNVPAASQISAYDSKQYLNQGGCYFVHRGGTLLGIGLVSDGQIRVVAAVKPGAGETVVTALAGAIPQDTVKVQVADNNMKAIRLYERLGFIPCGVVETWYKII